MAYVDGMVDAGRGRLAARAASRDSASPTASSNARCARWIAQLDRYRTRDLPELDFLCDWLETNRPDDEPAAILHGDYSPFNVMVAPDHPARLAAIIDWDTGTIGDPLLDIGHLLARWTEPGEEPVDRCARPAASTGYPPRARWPRATPERSRAGLVGAPLLRGTVAVQARR